MAKQQFFGLKFPFTSDKEEVRFLDLNESLKEKIKSEIVHIIFTPKGQRLRNPMFGTDLIKYIFEQNDQTLWNDVKNEISTSVTKNIPNVIISDINVYKNENNENEIIADIDYAVKIGNQVEIGKITTQI